MRSQNVDRRRDRERGSAMIEFMLFAVLLFVPLSLGMADVSNYFSALMAGESAAREAARGYSLAPSSQLGASAAQAIAIKVLGDAGIRYRDFKLRITCSASPCLTPGASITAVVDLRADLRVLSRAIHVEEIEPVDS
jgi:Flp pilus assembly protein TadG